MNNLLQQTETETETTRHHHYGELQEGILELPAGHRPQTIYVSAFQQGGHRIPAFALRDSGPFYPDGFLWKCSDRPLFVTFVFSKGIAGVCTQHKEIPFSECFEGRQHMFIPPSAQTYHFDVEFTCGNLHDPIIIVQPGGGGGPP